LAILRGNIGERADRRGAAKAAAQDQFMRFKQDLAVGGFRTPLALAGNFASHDATS
jgi:hypothetical protein